MTRNLTVRTFTYFVSAAFFLSVQIVFCFGTLGWLIAAVLGVVGKDVWIIAAVLAIPTAVLILRVWVIAYNAETDPANHM